MAGTRGFCENGKSDQKSITLERKDMFGLLRGPDLQKLDSYATLYLELLNSLSGRLLEKGQSQLF